MKAPQQGNKEGILHSFIVILIITLVAFIIILVFAIRTGYIANEDRDTNICRITLAAQDMSKIGVGGAKLDSPLASACKRRTIDITDRGAYLVKPLVNTKLALYIKDGTAMPKTTSYDLMGSETQQVLANHFAESMRRCWLRGLEGEVEVFNDRSYALTSTVCMICDETHVQLTTNNPTQGAWLSTYLATTKMPSSKEGLTYGEYLFNLKSADQSNFAQWLTTYDWREFLIFGLPGKDGYTLSGQTLCITEKGIDMNPQIRDGSYATIFFRDFSKRQFGCMATVVVPAQQVRRMCDYVAN